MEQQEFLMWFQRAGGIIHPHLHLSRQNDQSCFLARQELPPMTAIAVIPNSLLLTVQKCSASKLASFYCKHQQLFESQNDDDNQYNMLACFLVWQLSKGIGSKWYPYLMSMGSTTNMIHWGLEIISADSLKLLEEASFFKQSVTVFLEKLIHAMSQSHFFSGIGKERLARMTEWAYSAVMTRSFGYCTPSICMAPVGDLFNHHHDCGQHCLISPTLQKQPVKGYYAKSTIYDLSLMGIARTKEMHAECPMYQTDSQDNDSNSDDQEEYEAEFCRFREEEWMQELHGQEQALIFDNEVAEAKEQTQEQLAKRFRQRLVQRIENKIPKSEEVKRMEEAFMKDDEFEWCQEVDDIHFVITTQRRVAKGEQVFVCYGRRTNQFLLMWYGFAYPNNIYDSVSFRLRPQGKSYEDPLSFRLQQMLFEGYYGGYGLVKGLRHNNQIIQKQQLSREFRLKFGKFPFLLLEFLRIYLTEGYQSADSYRLQVSQPISLRFQSLALFSLLYLLQFKLSRFSTTLEEDSKALHLAEGKTYFCIIFRMEQKRILESNIALTREAISFLESFQKQLDEGECSWTNKEGSYCQQVTKNYKHFKSWRELKGKLYKEDLLY